MLSSLADIVHNSLVYIDDPLTLYFVICLQATENFPPEGIDFIDGRVPRVPKASEYSSKL